tara:strand:+ start:421 stop:699 length:279 start_codon:yes stop_codon:yes gene_type:complete
MENINEVISNIESVQAIRKGTTEKFRIDLVMGDGQRVTIKKSGNLPSVVQAYSFTINGNARDEIARHFMFSKTLDRFHSGAHLKTFLVEVAA